MKRFWLFLSTLAILAVPALAYAQQTSQSVDWSTMVTWQPLYMRNTNAPTGSVVRNANWAFGEHGQGNLIGFADSTVFRRGATTATVYDTSCAYSREEFPFQPVFGPGFPAALQDSILPWIVIRVVQDTVSYAFTGTSGLDSVRVAIEYSYDGINWFSCAGTPTLRFDTVYMTNGADGLQSPTIIGVEGTPGEDAVIIPIKCRLATISANSYITNLTSCIAGNYIRFIIGMDASGQFKAEYASWKRSK